MSTIEEIRQISKEIAKDEAAKKRRKELKDKAIAKSTAEKLGSQAEVYMSDVHKHILEVAKRGYKRCWYAVPRLDKASPVKSRFFKRPVFPEGVTRKDILKLIAYNLHKEGYEVSLGYWGQVHDCVVISW